jgi:hypothetical protein
VGKRIKTLSICLFILTTIYTCYGILKLGREGGPCNGGLAIIILTPLLLVCFVLLIVTFSISVSRRLNLDKPIILALISLVSWTLGSLTFLEDSFKETVLYLGFFEVFNIYVLVVLTSQRRLNKIKKANDI